MSVFIIVILIFLSGLTLSSQDADPAFNLIVEGNQLAQQGFLKEAYNKFTEALIVNPKSEIALLNKAQLLYWMWDYEEAIKEYNKAIDLLSNYDALYLDRGMCYAYMGYFDKAIEDFTKAIELNDQENHPAYLNRGVLYQIMGDRRYKKDYEKVLPFINTDAYFYDRIASFVGLNLNPEIFNPEIALEYSTKANDMTGWMDVELLYTMAEIFYQKAKAKKTGEVNEYYLDKAIQTMGRIFSLQDWLKVEQNGYYIYRWREMLSEKERLK